MRTIQVGVSVDERERAYGWLFERFLRELLDRIAASGEVLASLDLLPTSDGRHPFVRDGSDFGIDFVVLRAGQPLLVQAKAHTPQTVRRLQGLIVELQVAAQAFAQAFPGLGKPRLILAFPGVLYSGREGSARAAGVEVWDGHELSRLARQYGLPVPTFLTGARDEVSDDERPDQPEPVQELLDRLDSIPLGKGGWVQFEKYCQDLLGLLFCPPLSQVITQSSTENGVNRRDFILPNYAPEGFWHFMRVQYRADFVVAEAKNYSSPVHKNEVLQLANYLTHHGTGLVGVLLTRNGLDQGARWTSREQWLLHNKLIVGLDEQDYRQMLSTMQAGDDPSELIRQRIEDFRLRI